jgi:DNA-directed RNA polymerase specialized sigma24 family protein
MTETRMPTKKQLEAYRLVYIQGLSVTQAAGILRICTRGVYYRIERAKLFIKKGKKRT